MVKTLEQLKPASYGPFYAAGLYPKLADIFRRHGYALAVHGSVGTDFDLIAVPWVEDAADPETIAAEVNTAFAAKFSRLDFEVRPHGRITYKLAISFGTCALDISFTPRARWLPIETAPRDGTWVLMLFKPPRTPIANPHFESFAGIQFVARWHGSSEWCFAAPVGMGGFPDEWLQGWRPMPSNREVVE